MQDIEKAYICSDVCVASDPVPRDVPPSRMAVDASEDKSVTEGTVRYDLKFTCSLPGSEGIIGLVINVEAQRTFDKDYPIHTRAAYYCARLLSSQIGSILKKVDYENLRRVYSIWICEGVDARHRNSINEYRMAEIPREGREFGNGAGHDLMRIVMVCLGDPDEAKGLLRMLDILYADGGNDGMQAKKDMLANEFGIAMTETIEKELENMCNFSQGVIDRAVKKANELVQAERAQMQAEREQERAQMQAEREQERAQMQTEREQERAQMRAEREQERAQMRAEWEQEREQERAQVQAEIDRLQALVESLQGRRLQ